MKQFGYAFLVMFLVGTLMGIIFLVVATNDEPEQYDMGSCLPQHFNSDLVDPNYGVVFLMVDSSQLDIDTVWNKDHEALYVSILTRSDNDPVMYYEAKYYFDEILNIYFIKKERDR